ncbi:HAMP domain-containing sensor histidine kinase [Sphingomonas sp. LY29]|uniref:sensor histidine kinase n=1 Tax=unclassified Sphingomonas TaxID=196159 RepID=UPI002ADEBDB6|nr:MULTISPECIES: HAMP domain-containing sensor histidine kinase [unclassified Sphingomonas]MEA1071351.1 HAMP domain-containing sensor histidine kinase [Sphingomonas sp. LY160]WRP25963.1 HAMP domain-containing sensor histidine kinase [Sphingomonas sp. LY29]
MASATASAKSDDTDLVLTWSGRWTLSHRILAVNILTLALVLLAILFLDSYRNRLQKERLRQVIAEAAMAATALPAVDASAREQLLGQLSRRNDSRIRLYAPDGSLTLDSWRVTGPTYRLRDPSTQRWTKDVARAIDRGFNAVVGQDSEQEFAEPAVDRADAWEEVVESRATGRLQSETREAPELTPVFSAAAPVAGLGTLFVTDNDRAFTRTVRKQRRSLALALGVVATLSVLLSLFLARTIVRPLRRIAIAAHRVRLGRAREVKVPRLPSRRDEIGLLARSVSDMSQSLRQRIDNIEAFAADVTHELKNPLASLRSAVDSLERVDDPALRKQLIDVIRQDVVRLDRLIGDVGEAARTDAELARARFEPVDLGILIGQLVKAWEGRRETGSVRLAFARPRKASAIVMAEPNRLVRAIDNLIDNAISFSPPGGLVEIAATHVGDDILIRIDDEGPGVPPEQREAIFNRFHSVRPASESFGRHSGLGLAIARAIVEGHDGEIDVADRDDAPSGARFTIKLKAADRA